MAPQLATTHLASFRLWHNPPQPTHKIHSPNCYSSINIDIDVVVVIQSIYHCRNGAELHIVVVVKKVACAEHGFGATPA